MAFTLSNLTLHNTQAYLRASAGVSPAASVQSSSSGQSKVERASAPILADIDFEFTAKQHEQFAARMNKKVEYDYETSHQQQAIAQYLQTQHAQVRAEIQHMVGVDLYA